MCSAGVADDAQALNRVRVVPPPSDGQKIFQIDPMLYSLYRRIRSDIDEHEGGLEAFSRSYEKFGFNRSAEGITYREWAPGALFAALVGDFNNWDPNADRMSKVRMDTPSGIKDSIPAWIKYSVQAPGEIPYDGIYYDPPAEVKYVFKHPQPKRPKSFRIYETHVGMSSPTMLAICNTLGTFSPQEDLKSLIDRAHELGLLVLMDVVHSHASSNTLDGLNGFDGTDTHYFHSGPRGHHWMWDSRLFNYGNWEVLRFLLSNGRWWLEEYKFDGFRFDGVTSMMYTHHGLQVTFTGNFNEYFGFATDVDAVVYLMLVNDLIHGLYPEAVTIGEDVSGMPTFALPVHDGGVGFDYRMHMAVADKWIELLK
ncbi:unnamed protein product [Miscanthus lutarioriparius]|uniref:Glycoside hydrolase family 13 N-terminal domain-containing protein n=1 Tax=Miscanthus lutarioriparius TaxID=422564 RepID=A0A811Q4E9_9POAL|nr:unnamed protein product [Miscanthus lutarioriparius]